MNELPIVWHKVLDNKNELQEGKVMTVTAGHIGIRRNLNYCKYVMCFYFF